MPLIELLRSTSEGQNATHKTTPSTAVENAITQQLKLGPDLLFKGYITTLWINAIKDHAKKDFKKIMAHILLGLWRALFKPVWAFQNTILHDETNFVTQRYHQTLTNDLKEWKRKSKTLLHHTQQVLLDYTTEEMERWTIPTKQLTLSVLSDANKAYTKYKQHIQTGTHTLDHYWGPP